MFVHFGEQKFVKSHCIIKHGGIVSIKTDVAIFQGRLNKQAVQNNML